VAESSWLSRTRGGLGAIDGKGKVGGLEGGADDGKKRFFSGKKEALLEGFSALPGGRALEEEDVQWGRRGDKLIMRIGSQSMKGGKMRPAGKHGRLAERLQKRKAPPGDPRRRLNGALAKKEKGFCWKGVHGMP